MTIRKRIIYHGTVQGVGFRATCHSIASRRGVGGFVRNLSDGGVELEVEGEASEVEAVLSEVARRMDGYIRAAAATDQPVRGEREFRITHERAG